MTDIIIDARQAAAFEYAALRAGVDADDGCFVATVAQAYLSRKQGRHTESSIDEPANPVDIENTHGVKFGDLWMLGSHKLMCGDSSNREHVDILLRGEKLAALLSTDPPYGVAFEGGKFHGKPARNWKGISNDEIVGDNLRQWLHAVFSLWVPRVADDGAFYAWTAPLENASFVMNAMKDCGIHVQSQIVWNKNFLVIGRGDFHWKHEVAWYGFRKGKNHKWYADRTKTTVWDVARVKQADYLHPMQKPIELYSWPMDYHTQEGEICLEPFCGSGTQIVAAEQLGRRCMAMEISPEFCSVAISRWEKLTGKTAVRM